MLKIDKIFFINLNRRPERKIHFENQCIKHKIPAEQVLRMPAIDGLSYNFTENELSMFSKANFLNNNIIANKIMGNQLSHYYLLKHIIIEKHKYAIICQDDVVFKDNFIFYINKIIDDLPEGVEIINLGLHKYAEYNDFISWDLNSNNDKEYICESLHNEFIGLWKKSLNPCSLAYIVTLNGAINIVNYFEQNGFNKATDMNYNEYLINNNIFYGSTSVLATTNMTFESDIFC